MAQFWLMKTEPTTFSIDHLKREGASAWEGVRNYQARNFMRDSMAIGDKVLIYHSNTNPPGITGLAEIISDAYPDHFALNSKSKYFDPRATQENPIWMMRDVKFIEKWDKMISLEDLKKDPNCAGMWVVKKGMRLSIQPVEEKDYLYIMALKK